MAIFILLLLRHLVQTRGYADLSIDKPATQTSLWSCAFPRSCHLYEAGNALDRDTHTCMRTGAIGGSSSSKEVQWQVDLGGIRSVYKIRILFRSYGEKYVSRQRERFAGFSLHLSNSTNKEDGHVCYKDGPKLPPLDFNTTCVGHARYLTFHNERSDNKTYPDGYARYSVTELCEVIVQGCEQGVYGSNCTLSCADNCQERRCDVINGTCIGCLPGWNGKFCEQPCPEGSYGLECKSICSGHCKDNITCNHVTGECKYGCTGGWTGSHCYNRCPIGTYGQNCVFNCSRHCLISGYCERDTGQCNKGCSPGYIGLLCETGCPPAKFGQGCSNNCSGHCINDENCRNTDGTCRNGCVPGYRGDLCNEACRPGFYGSKCTSRCSKNCIDTCGHIDGLCLCAPGWTGSPYCNKACDPGTYGKDCKEVCGHCEGNVPCNHINGSCPGLCEPGYQGQKCLTKCESGRYGEDCSSTCGHCATNATCDEINGACPDGNCAPGWTDIGDRKCDRACNDGWYGAECKERCGYCRNNKPCNRVTGSCSGFCEPGYHGEKCEESEFSQLLAIQRKMLNSVRELLSFKRRKVELIANGTSPTDLK